MDLEDLKSRSLTKYLDGKGGKGKTIFLGFRGSIAYGMFVPSTDPNSIDDIDLMAVEVPPLGYYTGLREYNDTKNWLCNRGTEDLFLDEFDTVTYELRKFLFLLSKGNPNVLSLLWLDKKYIILSNPVFNTIVEHRGAFATKEIYHSFAGYASSQLYKMTHQVFQGYMGDKRKQLVEKYGYDCKNAAHLIRLLRMCIEFLGTGYLQVDREGVDADELLEIKNGKWKLDTVVSMGEDLFQKAKQAYEKSILPPTANMHTIECLCQETVESTNIARI